MYEYREQLLEAIEKFQVLIVTAETGSGKTTQVRAPREACQATTGACTASAAWSRIVWC